MSKTSEKNDYLHQKFTPKTRRNLGQEIYITDRGGKQAVFCDFYKSYLALFSRMLASAIIGYGLSNVIK